MKRMKTVIKILIGSSLLVYFGSGLGVWLDYQRQPEAYAIMSADWTSRILVLSSLMGVLLAIEMVLYWIISKKETKS